MATQTIELDKISPSAIPLIRPIRGTDSEEYQKLASAIHRDGQHNPILVRRLTDEERQGVDEGVEFGILDGHHRYDIARNTEGMTTIEAKVSDREASPIEDIRQAFQMNDTNITMAMTNIEKGQIIKHLKELTGMGIPEIGAELFGVKDKMAYRYVEEYDKSLMPPVDKPATSYSKRDFARLLKEIPQSEADIDLSNPEAAGAQLRAIWKLEEQLKTYKGLLSKSDAVKKVANQLGADERKAQKAAEAEARIPELRKQFKIDHWEKWKIGQIVSELLKDTCMEKDKLYEKLGFSPQRGDDYLKSYRGYEKFVAFIKKKQKELRDVKSLELWEKAQILLGIAENNSLHDFYMSTHEISVKLFNEKYFGRHTPREVLCEYVMEELFKQLEQCNGDISLLHSTFCDTIKELKSKIHPWSFCNEDMCLALEKRTGLAREVIAKELWSEKDRKSYLGKTASRDRESRREEIEAEQREAIADVKKAARKNVEQQGEDNLTLKEKKKILFDVLDTINRIGRGVTNSGNIVMDIARELFPSWTRKSSYIKNRNGKDVPMDEYLSASYRRHQVQLAKKEAKDKATE